MANAESTRNKLIFAERRLRDIRHLNNGKLEGANGQERQQLIQEFFFHLVGSIDFLLQVVNQERHLNLDEEDVNIREICARLSNTDPIKPLLQQLHPNPKKVPLTGSVYSEENNHLRIMMLRHKVVHQGDNPFHLRMMKDLPNCSLFLNPTCPKSKGSKYHVFDELDIFLKLVWGKSEKVLKLLGK